MAKKRAHRKMQKRKQCNESDCTKEPCFGPLDGDRKSAMYCKTHIPKEELEKWENVVQKRCEGKTNDGHSCKKQPSFGVLNGDKGSAMYCKTHVPKGEHDKWENVVKKRCEGITSDGHACKKHPNFGPVGEGQRSARYCLGCIPVDDRDKWEDVVHKRCEGITSDGHACKTQPKFGPVDGDKKSARFCARCLPVEDRENWEDVVSKRCEGITTDGHVCKTQPRFGPVDGDKKSARFCARCLPVEDRENWEDVVSKRCEGITTDGLACKTQPHFGQVGGDKTARFCARCIPVEDRENWEDVVNKRCEAPDCAVRRSFGPLGGGSGSARFCQTHAPDSENWENVVDKRCAQQGCSTTVKVERYRGYCLPCFASLFPLEPVSRNYKTKERLVVQAVHAFLKRDFTHLEVTYDKQVVGGCSKRRPDIAVDVLTHVIIVECDEDGHNTESYCTCENKRMMQLFQDYGNRPFVLIRFNPDAYVNSHGLKIASCFSRTKTGLVKLVKAEMWTERLRVLQERLQVHLVNIPGSELSVEHLYYDGFH